MDQRSSGVLAFLGAFVHSWAALMSGGISVPIAAWGLFEAPDDQKFWFLILAVACVIIAAYFVWKKERDELRGVVSALDRERDSSNPKLSGRIYQFIVGEARGMPGCVCHLNMEIINNGAPSAVLRWKASVDIGGMIYEGSLQAIQNGTRLESLDRPTLMLASSDAIYDKAVTPIPRGGVIRGWLRVDLNNVDRFKMNSAFPKWTVTLYDIQGAPIEVTGESSGVSKGLKYIPDGSGGLRFDADK